MTPRRLLVVTYGFPPSPLVSGVRWSLMAKYLARFGHTVFVVTSDALGGLPDDGDRVIRPRNLESSQALRHLLRRPLPTVSGGRSATPSEAAPPVPMRLFVPDPWTVSWAPFALRAAKRLVREQAIDCVITTSPGESTHLVGLGLQRLGAAWVADFRDGWTFETARPPFPTRLQRRLDARLESLVVTHADLTVAVTEGIAEDFRTRLGVEAALVPNGVDPEAHELPPEDEAHVLEIERRDDTVRLVYTGRLGVATPRRRAEGFFKALERLSREDPDLAARLELIIAGPQSLHDAELLASLRCTSAVTHIGRLPRAESLRLQRSADVLVLLGSDGSEAPAKLFEYLGAHRPVLHAGGPGAAARILTDLGSGVTVPHDDIDALVAQLRLIAKGEFAADVAPGGLERYSYPYVAELMYAAIEDAIQRRRTRAPGAS